MLQQIYHYYFTVIKKILSEDANSKFSEILTYLLLVRLEIEVLFNKLKLQWGAEKCHLHLK